MADVSSASAKPATYTVKRGDNLSRIGRELGLSWRQLYDANRDIISNPDLIHPGQVLKVPGGGGDSGARSAAAGASTTRATPPSRTESASRERDDADAAGEEAAADDGAAPAAEGASGGGNARAGSPATPAPVSQPAAAPGDTAGSGVRALMQVAAANPSNVIEIDTGNVGYGFVRVPAAMESAMILNLDQSRVAIQRDMARESARIQELGAVVNDFRYGYEQRLDAYQRMHAAQMEMVALYHSWMRASEAISSALLSMQQNMVASIAAHTGAAPAGMAPAADGGDQPDVAASVDAQINVLG